MATKVNCECEQCKVCFQKTLAEFNRSNKLGKCHFCSLRCSSRHTYNKLGTPYKFSDMDSKKGTEAARLSKIDEFTPFRYFIRKNASHKHNKIELSLLELKEMWEKQNGICEHTGILLVLPTSIAGFNEDIPPHKRASIDRIDNTKGYTINNIHYVSFMSNMAKNRFSESSVRDFVQDIRDCGEIGETRQT